MSLEMTNASGVFEATERPFNQPMIASGEPGIRYDPSSDRGGVTTGTPAISPSNCGSCNVTGRSSNGTKTIGRTGGTAPIVDAPEASVVDANAGVAATMSTNGIDAGKILNTIDA